MKKERLVWISLLLLVLGVQLYGFILSGDSLRLEKIIDGYKDKLVNLRALGGDTVGKSSEHEYSEEEYYELLEEVVGYIRNNYVDESKISYRNLMYGGIKGMLGSLDDSYSSFLSEDDLKELNESLSNQFGGLGIYIGLRDRYPTVIAPIEGSPGYKAGIQSMDKIVEIEGKSSRDLNISDVVKILRGEPGTKVSIKVSREEALDLIPMTITRAIINVPTVKYGFIKKGLGYIRIISFGKQTVNKLKEALFKLRKAKLQRLVIDLRNNPGGFLKSAVSTSDMFFDKGKIVYTEGRKKGNITEFYAHEENTIIEKDVPIVVLVNQGSASASEIVAGALQDSKRAILVGSKTFGKASVQNIISLKNGNNKIAIRLTVQKYYTPSGKEIHNKGITPDIVVKVAKKTFDDIYMDNKMAKGKYVKTFVKKHYNGASYREKDYDNFRKVLKKEGIVIKDRDLRRYIRDEKYKKHVRLFDLDYDAQLQKAVSILEKPINYNKILNK